MSNGGHAGGTKPITPCFFLQGWRAVPHEHAIKEMLLEHAFAQDMCCLHDVWKGHEPGACRSAAAHGGLLP